MKIKKVKTWYLQMFNFPKGATGEYIIENTKLPQGVAFCEVKNIPLDYYQFLYKKIGDKWGWTHHLLMPDAELANFIQSKNCVIYILYIEGVPGGFVEFDVKEKDVEMLYLGLAPEFIGKGFGRLLLCSAIKIAWESNPERLWLHTCEHDHHAAIEAYKKAGFEIFKEEIIEELYPENF